MIRPGEVDMADFAEAGPHPVIVLSREELNRGRYALLSQLDLADGSLGMVDEMAFRDVIKAIGYVMDSDCEPV
jgi:hypothetical protein